MNFEEAVNKFKEELNNLERVNKSSIEFTIRNLRSLIDFGEMADKKKKTLSDKIKLIFNEKTNEETEICPTKEVKEAFQKIKQRILNQTGNECDAKIARDYAIIIIDEEIGERLI